MVVLFLAASLSACATGGSKDAAETRAYRNQRAVADATAGRAQLQQQVAEQRAQERFIDQREGRVAPH
ncbi:hypothetical protein [Lysobacter xanthus]